MRILLQSSNKGCLLLALFVATACSDPSAVPPPAVAVQIEGARNATLFVGEGRIFEATVTGSSVRRVIWRSTNPAVATVDTTGLVITRDTGTTWVVATAEIDAQSRDSVRLDVRRLVIEEPGPSVSITSIVKEGTNTAVDRNAVTGAIVVTSFYDWPPTALPVLRVRLNDQTVCQTQLTTRNGSLPCTINTALFANGAATLRVELVVQTGVIHASVSAPLVLAN